MRSSRCVVRSSKITGNVDSGKEGKVCMYRGIVGVVGIVVPVCLALGCNVPQNEFQVVERWRGGHTDVVTDVAFNPVHPQLATACMDGRVRFFSDAA